MQSPSVSHFFGRLLSLQLEFQVEWDLHQGNQRMLSSHLEWCCEILGVTLIHFLSAQTDHLHVGGEGRGSSSPNQLS